MLFYWEGVFGKCEVVWTYLEEHLDLECVFDGCTKALEHIKERSEEYSFSFNKDVVVYSQHRKINNIGLVACRIHYNIKLVDFVVEYIFDIFYLRKSVCCSWENNDDRT